MKKCENCNLILQDGDAFCPKCGGATVECDSGSPAEGETACSCRGNCGCGEENCECGEQAAENMQAEPRMQFVDDGKKKKSKKGFFAAIIAAVIVVLGIGAALVYMFVLNTPSKQFLMAQAKMFKTEWSGEITAEDILKGKGQPVKRDFSSDVSVSIDTDNQNINNVLSKLSLEYKIKDEGSEYLLNGELDYNGSPLLSCVLTADENTVGLYVPELSNKYYVTEKGLAEQVLTNEYGREYDPIEYDKLDSIEKAYNSLVKRYGKILLGGIDDEDVKVEKNVTVQLELLEKEFKGCKVYTYTPDKERIAAALKALSGEMREDEELFNYVCSLTEFYYGSDALTMLGAYVSETGVTEAETWQERQAALADYIAEHADEFARQLVETEVRMEIVVHKGKPVMQTIRDSEAAVCFEIVSDKEELLLAWKGINDNYQAGTSLVAELTREDGVLNGKVDINNIDSGESCRVVSVELKDISSEKKSAFGIPYGTVTVTVTDEDVLSGEEMTYTLSTGASENGGTEHLMKMELPKSLAPSLESLGFSGTLSEMTLKIYSTDKASTAKAPDADSTNLSSEEEIEDALNEMTEELANIILQFAFSEMM
mgnify:CR=1 FL=1